MFERYTERARQVIVLAQDEARLMKHNYIGGEHILLGLLREQEGLAVRVLDELGLTVDEARNEVKARVPEGDEATTGQIPFTPRAKKMLESALREALSLGHNYIATEHILLGLAREEEGIAMSVLRDYDIDGERIRNEVIRCLTTGRKAARQAVEELKPDLRLLHKVEALQQIIVVLGPTVACPHNKCEGCQAEMAEALRIAQEAIA